MTAWGVGFEMRIRILCVAWLLALSSTAVAAPSGQDRAMAESLFQEAKKLAAGGKLELACKKFEDSFQLDPTLGTKLHSAACYEELGRTASAWAAFNEAAAMAAEEGDVKRMKIAKKRLAKLEKELPKLTIEVPKGIDGIRVELDGNNLGTSTLESALPVDPGPHKVTVTAPGHEPWTTTITVEKGAGSDTLSVPTLVPLEEEATEDPAEDDSSSASVDTSSSNFDQRTAGFIVGGVGLVALAAGGFFGLQAQSKTKDADDHCSGNFCNQEGLDGHDDAKQAALFSTIGFGVGIAGIAAGTVLILTAKPKKERAAWVAPYATGRGGGLAAGGHF